MNHLGISPLQYGLPKSRLLSPESHPALDISLLISNFTREEGLEETESKSEERSDLQADSHENKIFIAQLLCAWQWGLVGITPVGVHIGWKESNTLLHINDKVN